MRGESRDDAALDKTARTIGTLNEAVTLWECHRLSTLSAIWTNRHSSAEETTPQHGGGEFETGAEAVKRD